MAESGQYERAGAVQATEIRPRTPGESALATAPRAASGGEAPMPAFPSRFHLRRIRRGAFPQHAQKKRRLWLMIPIGLAALAILGYYGLRQPTIRVAPVQPPVAVQVRAPEQAMTNAPILAPSRPAETPLVPLSVVKPSPPVTQSVTTPSRKLPAPRRPELMAPVPTSEGPKPTEVKPEAPASNGTQWGL